MKVKFIDRQKDYSFKHGQPYIVRFMDHCRGSKGGMMCEIIVWFVENTGTAYHFCWWNVMNQPSDTIDDNRETVDIIKGTLLKVTKL